jgi:RNA polymerase sigma factor (sigma-70 family)
MPDKKIPNPEKAVQERELKEKANQVLSTLKSREEKILQMRCNNISLEEIGGKFSVSRQRIEKIEKRAISKLRKGKKREMLQGFV